MGYDLVTFSGGKAIRGPQCAGLLLGREDLVHYAQLNNSPYEDTIGRSQKVGKEEIVAMIKALEIHLAEDQEALATEWQQRLETISQQVRKIAGVSTNYFMPPVANRVPHMNITWDQNRIRLTPEEASRLLRAAKPSIVIGGGKEGSEGYPGLVMNSFQLQPGEEKIVAERMVELLRDHSA
jgi:L-seryl-tRNA(Ser) seleniumtransferase